MRARHLLSAMVALGCSFFSPSAWAQNLEYVEGPVLGSNRIIGMGGAFVSVAEGADAHMINPASYGMRYPHAREGFFDWDFSIYWLNDSPGDATNPDLSGKAENVDRTFLVGLGLDFRLSGFGFGFHGRGRSADFIATDLRTGNQNRFSLTQTIASLGIGIMLRSIDMTIGLALTPVSVSLDDGNADPLLSYQGSGVGLGWLWAPEGRPFRLGAAFRSRILAVEETTNQNVELDLPELEGLEAPAEFTVGGSYMIWERNYNPTYTLGSENAPPLDERVPTGARRYILFAADLQVRGTSENAVSAGSYLSGDLERAGEDVTYSPRVGIESEFWANQMRGRLGGYWEASRLESTPGRPHLTVGFDFRIPLIWEWRLNSVIDISDEFFNWGLGVGFWH